MILSNDERAANQRTYQLSEISEIATTIYGAYPEADSRVVDRCIGIGLSPRQVSEIVAYGLPLHVMTRSLSPLNTPEETVEQAMIEADEMQILAMQEARRRHLDYVDEDEEEKYEREAIIYQEEMGIARATRELEREVTETILAAYSEGSAIAEKCVELSMSPSQARELVSFGLRLDELETVLFGDLASPGGDLAQGAVDEALRLSIQTSATSSTLRLGA